MTYHLIFDPNDTITPFMLFNFTETGTRYAWRRVTFPIPRKWTENTDYTSLSNLLAYFKIDAPQFTYLGILTPKQLRSIPTTHPELFI